MCGVQKTGIHWGEINYAPYPIGDTARYFPSPPLADPSPLRLLRFRF